MQINRCIQHIAFYRQATTSTLYLLSVMAMLAKQIGQVALLENQKPVDLVFGDQLAPVHLLFHFQEAAVQEEEGRPRRRFAHYSVLTPFVSSGQARGDGCLSLFATVPVPQCSYQIGFQMLVIHIYCTVDTLSLKVLSVDKLQALYVAT